MAKTDRPRKQTLKEKLATSVPGNNDGGKKKFTSGDHGEYLIGTDPDNIHHFIIETVEVPGTRTREPYRLKKIIGDISAFGCGNAVNMPFSWLFKEASACKFAPGKAGVIQSEMLSFLQNSLKEELAAAKEAYLENKTMPPPHIEPCMTEEDLDILAQTRANALMQQVAERPHDLIFKIATVDGKAVKPHHPSTGPLQARPRENLRPLSLLMPGAFGRYDFGDKDRHCIVDYFPLDQMRTILRIIAIHPEHLLMQAGVCPGTGLLGYHLSKENPLPFPKNFEGKERKLYESRVLMRDFFIKRLDEAKGHKEQEQPRDEQATA